MIRGLVLLLLFGGVVIMYWRPLKSVRTVLGVDHLISTGHAFLVVGFAFGWALGDRSTPVAEDLSPVVSFVAGWVGFASGMRFDWRVLRRVPRRAFFVALLPSLLAALVVGVASGGALLYAGTPVLQAVASALVLAAAAASSGPTLAALARSRRAGRTSEARAALRMIEFSAGVDDLIVVILAVLAFALSRPVFDPIASLLLVGATLGGGIVLGVITWLFLGGRATEDERLLLGLAMLAFISGFAGWLHLSPAGTAAISAVVLVNLPGDRAHQLVESIRRVERPAVVILMIVIGFHASRPLTAVFVPLVLLMTLWRFVAKHAGGQMVVGTIPGAPGLATHTRWAYGLTPQGALGLIVTLSFFHVWRDPTARSVLAAVAGAALLNELVAPWLVVRFLRGMGSLTSVHAGSRGHRS